MPPRASAEDKEPPNILFVFADDWRADVLGIAGHPIVQTPVLDGLANQGVHFTEAFAQSPMCAPSRMTVLTGLSQSSHGGDRPPFQIRAQDARQSFPALLRQAGYRTRFNGKVHFAKRPQPAGQSGGAGQIQSCAEKDAPAQDEFIHRVSSPPQYSGLISHLMPYGIAVILLQDLRKLADAGALWQAHSGRFYSPEAKEQLSRPHPVGCLVRSLSGWAAWYERIMTGVSLGCEFEERGILVHPVANMVVQSAPDSTASFMGKAAQRKLMERYIQRHKSVERKLLLDDIWSDTVLREYADRLPPARLLLRPSPVEEIPSIHPDYAHGAMLGLSHLLGLG